MLYFVYYKYTYKHFNLICISPFKSNLLKIEHTVFFTKGEDEIVLMGSHLYPSG